jgi:hypothetical protein
MLILSAGKSRVSCRFLQRSEKPGLDNPTPPESNSFAVLQNPLEFSLLALT